MANVTYSFTLDTERDRRIIAWLNSLERGAKSAAIRAALHVHLDGQTPITHGDLYQAIKALGRKLESGAMVAGSGDGGDAPTDDFVEPPEAAANLAAQIAKWTTAKAELDPKPEQGAEASP